VVSIATYHGALLRFYSQSPHCTNRQPITVLCFTSHSSSNQSHHCTPHLWLPINSALFYLPQEQQPITHRHTTDNQSQCFVWSHTAAATNHTTAYHVQNQSGSSSAVADTVITTNHNALIIYIIFCQPQPRNTK